MSSEFELTFPSVDDITDQLKCLGRGTLLYKVDDRCALRHIKIDLGDYDLLGLQWNGTYIDMCLPFGTQHGSQIFKRLSNAVRYITREKGFCIIDYIDDYVRIGVPSVVFDSFNYLTSLMNDLDLTISKKKLVAPSTKIVCLGILIDT